MSLGGKEGGMGKGWECGKGWEKERGVEIGVEEGLGVWGKGKSWGF